LGRVDVTRWRRRLAEGGAPVRIVMTCRDGDDWRRVRQADSVLAERYHESMILLSAGEECGSDFPGRQLAHICVAPGPVRRGTGRAIRRHPRIADRRPAGDAE